MKKPQITLRQFNPEAADMWDYDLNSPDFNPDNVGGMSEKIAYFKCTKNSKHVFQKKISKMTSDRDGHNIGCIYCGSNAKIPFPGENDLFSVVLEANDMWDFNKNDLDPTILLPKSNKKAYFKCNKGHSILRKIQDFSRSPSCPECANEQTKLIYNHPNTSLFWNFNKNTNLSLEEEIQTSSNIAYFKCPNCNYEWQWTIELWHRRDYCPCCGFDGTDGSIERNKHIIAKNPIITLRMKHPDIDNQWDYEKNGYINPDSVTYASNLNAFLKCQNGHNFERTIYEMTSKDGSLKECPNCSSRHNRIIIGINDLFSICPDAKEMWDFNKNKSLKPTELSKTSSVEAHFKCNKGHRFKKRISSFFVAPKCPKCNFIEKHSVAGLKPDMIKFWNYDKMPYSPNEINVYSNETGYWKCSECGYEWEQKFANRAVAIAQKCPSCELGRVYDKTQTVANSFRKTNPDAAKLWIDDMNEGNTPDNLSEKSGKKVYLRCINNSEHIYKRLVHSIPKDPPYGCPVCMEENRGMIPGQTDLFSICTRAKKMWDYEKNKGFDTNRIYAKSAKKVWWTCEDGHSFQRKIKGFVESQLCPECKRKKNSIANFPHMLKQWNFKKNTNYDVNLTSSYLLDIVWWKCKKCGYEWQAQISSRRASKGLCPCCENRTVIVEGITDLFSMVPDLKQDFDYEKNKNISLNELSVTSQKQVWWLCQECGYGWESSPVGRLEKTESGYRIRNCPACVGLARNQTYAEEYPELIDRFIEAKNGCRLSDLIGADIKKIFWWHCDICGEDFDTYLSVMIRSRNTQNKGCPYCNGKRVKREKSFAALHPEVMDEFDPENTIDPYNVTEKSSFHAKWICRNNPQHNWESSFNARARGGGGCNICKEYRYNHMFYQEHSDFEPYYDKNKNERLFTSYSNMSNEPAWWKCDEGHSFEWRIMNFSRDNMFSCPYCEQKWLKPGINTLADTHPKLAKEWSDLNAKVPTDFFKKSYENVLWTCPTCNGDYYAKIHDREYGDDSCPYCTGRRKLAGFNTLDVTKKELIPEWSPNNERPMSDFFDTSTEYVRWICSVCNGEYGAHIRDREFGDDSCPYCTNQRKLSGFNTLEVTKKELIPEWSSNNERPMSDFLDTSSYKALWNCPTCGGEYQARIRDREVGDDSCPYCTNKRKLAGFNTLEVTKKELIPEWSLNNERPMSDFFDMSSYMALWDCPTCGGEYRARIRDREVGDDSCPFCSNKKILSGYNSFAARHSDLMLTWDYINNYILVDPDSVGDNCNEKVWWFCEHNKEHKYLMSPKQRLYFQKRNMESCTYCKGYRRKKRHFI